MHERNPATCVARSLSASVRAICNVPPPVEANRRVSPISEVTPTRVDDGEFAGICGRSHVTWRAVRSASGSCSMAEGGVTPFEMQDVRGYLHRPDRDSDQGIVLTHGAGGNCDGPLLVALADAFCKAGMTVLRCDLPFRQRRPKGPPSPATA